ncbi:hypothetical protein EPD60_16185 [Flaviaesturariibacter flavus]|uniref:UspA domain-containing protein n=1 Tax=Flaviaesturariibacter flavus TaxID=2502780 RepID=A0A4R1B235_9BACT|nr:universal stress protein [Flaviaesturariibacter flavus]TCJ12094.1 hypothetical protein EPD60_16185 [Flaviaesturariibacter flavus]
MKTLLIPVDRSETAQNAVGYAAALVSYLGYERVILLESLYDTLFDEMVLSSELQTTNAEYRVQDREAAEAQLVAMARQLKTAQPALEVEAILSERPIVRATLELVARESPSLILVGSDNREYDSDSYVSSHIIEITKASTVSVLIVPAGQLFRPIRHALIPIDTYSRPALNLIDQLAANPLSRDVEFDILNAAGDRNESRDTTRDESRQQDETLKNVRHALYFSEQKEILKAISAFVEKNAADLIIALPGKYSFLYQLTHRSLSEAICRNTKRPVLILKKLF